MARIGSVVRSGALAIIIGLALVPAWAQTAMAQRGGGEGPASAREQAASEEDGSLAEASPLRMRPRVEAFMRSFFLSGKPLSREEIRVLYAPSVLYFSKGQWTRERIVRDKFNYFRRWPLRRYRLLEETLQVSRTPSRPGSYDVDFLYEFDLSSKTESAKGRGRGFLTLDLSQPGGRITREGGTVLSQR